MEEFSKLEIILAGWAVVSIITLIGIAHAIEKIAIAIEKRGS